MPKRRLRRGATLPACFEYAHTFFLSGESSRQGKAGALWETAFPLLRPLPSPRTTPSFPVVSTRRIPPRSAFEKSLRVGYPAPRAVRFSSRVAALTMRGVPIVACPGEVLREVPGGNEAFGPWAMGAGKAKLGAARSYFTLCPKLPG